MNKIDLRRKILKIRNEMPKEDVVLHSKAICRKLSILLNSEDLKGKTIHSYLNIGNEVSLSDFILEYYDVCNMYTSSDSATEIECNLIEKCNTDKLCIGNKISKPNNIDIFVIPGVSYDYSLSRLGRGGGYYDRLLQLYPDAYKIGVCFDYQIVNRINVESHDVDMDVIITEKQILNKKIEQSGLEIDCS